MTSVEREVGGTIYKHIKNELRRIRDERKPRDEGCEMNCSVLLSPR